MNIIAHRGASAEAPENTLAAVNLAWAQGADAVEVDLRLTADGRVVAFHDDDTRRFEKVPRRIEAMTWAEVQTLDVGAWKGERFRGERVPRLEAILATIPRGKRAVLELKGGVEMVPEFARLVQGCEVCVIGFAEGTLRESRRFLAEVEHYWIVDYHHAPPDLETMISRAKAAGFAGLDLSADWPLDQEAVGRIHAAGLKVIVWTADDVEEGRRLQDAGIDGLTTNRPGAFSS